MFFGNQPFLKQCAIFIITGLLFSGCAVNKKQQLDKFSETLCRDLLQSKPKSESYQKIFSETFRRNLNQAQFTNMTNGIVSQYGQCSKVTQRTEQGILTILTDRGNNLSMEVRLENDGKSLAGLYFHGVKNDLNRFRDKAQWICKELLKEEPKFRYQDHFAKSFRKAIPYRELIKISKDLHKKFGECTEIEIPNNALIKEFHTIQKDGRKLIFSLVAEKVKEDNLITGLLFKGEKTELISFKSKEEILKEFKKFDGLFSTLLIEDNQKVLDFKSNETHAIGSVFKLYVLAALAEKIKNGELKWDQKFPIKYKLKSLPSGVMQNYRKGTMVSIKDYASKMISISDNTATDHLIHIVGRKNIENFIEKQGLISKKSNYSPLLTTRELFATRAFFKEKDYMAYNEASRAKRLKMVRKAVKNNDKILKALKNWDNPRHIKDIEWYATPEEVCRLKFWMNSQADMVIKETLAINAPFAQENKSFNYSGYKGGSEPGVLEMAYLLQKKNQKWSCLYIGQNNTADNINHSKFFQLAQSILDWYGKN